MKKVLKIALKGYYPTANDYYRIQTDTNDCLPNNEAPSLQLWIIKFSSSENHKTKFLTKTHVIMNTLRNKVQLIGRLGDNVEVKTLESGKVLGKVSLATNETYKNQQGEKVTETTWHNLVIWGKSAEIIAKYTSKGSELAVEGKITNRSYTDKDGVKRYQTEIVVHDFMFLGGGKNQPSEAEKEEADLPF